MLDTRGMTEAEILLAEQELEKGLATFQTIAIIIIAIMILILVSVSVIKIYIRINNFKKELKEIKEEKKKKREG